MGSAFPWLILAVDCFMEWLFQAQLISLLPSQGCFQHLAVIIKATVRIGFAVVVISL